MVRSIHKTNIAILFAILAVASAVVAVPKEAKAENVTLDVNITEVLTVAVSAPTTWAKGDVNTLLVNKVNVSALTNNNVGALVSMYADGATLNNISTSATIPTLTGSQTVAAFPADYWGYSKDNATYYGVPTSSSPVSLFAATGAGNSTSQDVYFGAKASSAKDSGTYTQRVNFVAVTGTVDTSTPTIPSNPSTDVIANNTPTYTASPVDQTAYTSRSTTGSGTSSISGEQKKTSTVVTSGNTTSSSYANAAGVTTTSAGNNTASVATALGVAATVAAASGMAFFVAAKRRNEDEEEER